MDILMVLISIIVINLVLSGDNAVVIALVSRNLPEKQKKKAVLIGTAGAVILRVILTVVASFLLQIPYVQFIGGLALVYIATKLLLDKKETKNSKEAGGFLEAVKIILVADVIMSLDNVLAIAGVCKGNFVLLVAGLLISIPIVIFGSQILMKLMEKFPIIIRFGVAILGWTAAEMIVSDDMMKAFFEAYAFWFKIGITGSIFVLGNVIKRMQEKEVEVI